jgi:hypothetical protein
MINTSSDGYYTHKDNFMVSLDSRNATTYNNGSYNSNVRFDFNMPITLDTNALKMTASVIQFTAPNSLYIINETNNFLSITINGTLTYNVYFTYGNYNSATFMTMFANQFSGFSITKNSINNIFSIAHTTYNFTINSGSTIGDIMGFANNTNYTSLSFRFTMPYTCNFNGLQSFNIHFSNIGTRNIDSFTKSASDIIQTIPLDPNETLIKFIRQYDFNFTIFQDTIEYIDIQMKDDLGNYLNFNNQHWNLVLSFSVIHDMERFSHLKDFNSIINGRYL